MNNYVFVYLLGVCISFGITTMIIAEKETENEFQCIFYVVMGTMLSWIVVGLVIGNISNNLILIKEKQ